MLKVTLVKSVIGYDKRLRKTVSAMGLGKIGSSTVLPDNAPVRGMIRKTSTWLRWSSWLTLWRWPNEIA